MFFCVDLAGRYLKLAKVDKRGRVSPYGVHDCAALSDKDIAVLIKAYHDTSSRSRVLFFLSRTKVISRILMLPTFDPNEVARMISLQLSSLLPCDPNDVSYGFAALEVDTGSAVSFEAITKEDWARVKEMCMGCVQTPEFLEVSTWGIIAHVQKTLKLSSLMYSAIVIVDAAETTVLITQGDAIVQARMVRLGYRAYKEQSKVSFHRVADEVKHACELASSSEHVVAISQWVWGGVSKELFKELSKEYTVNAQVQYLEPVILKKTNFPGNDVPVQWYTAAGSVASVLSGRGVNLVPDEVQEKVFKKQSNPLRVLAMGMCILSVCILVLGCCVYLGKVISAAKDIEQERHEIAPDVAMIRGTHEDLSVVADVYTSKYRVLEWFVELYRLVPKGIFISEAQYSILGETCLLYTSPSPRDGLLSRMPSSA